VRSAGAQINPAGEHGERDIGRDDIHVVGPHYLARERDRHGHRRLLRENLRQQAFVPGVEMLDNDISHPCRGRQRDQELGNGFEASGRRSDAHDRQRHVCTRYATLPGEYKRIP
jgi:hypothetical protein